MPRSSGGSAQSSETHKGCCFGCMRFLVRFIFLVDYVAGIILFVYGFLVYNNSQFYAAAVLLSLASLLLFSSLVGTLGFTTKICSRCGLLLSAYLAIVIALAEVVMGISILVNEDDFINYLRENKDDLYLSDGGINTIQQLVWFFFVGCIGFAFAEVCRFFMMKNLRKKLIRYDDAPVDTPGTEPLIRGGGRGIPENEPFESIETEAEKQERWSRMLDSGDEERSARSGKSGTKSSAAYTSDDDFAPVDEPLYTDPHWWAKSSKDTENDMSWVTSPSDKYKKREDV